MLSSDYLRQRALYCLQDLVTRYLTEENLQGRHGRNTTTVSGREEHYPAYTYGKKSRASVTYDSLEDSLYFLCASEGDGWHTIFPTLCIVLHSSMVGGRRLSSSNDQCLLLSFLISLYYVCLYYTVHFVHISGQGLEASWSEQTPSESLVTSDDEFGRPARGEREGRREEGEEEESGSSNSTPRKPRDKAPFATDTVGDNVVRLDKVCSQPIESYTYSSVCSFYWFCVDRQWQGCVSRMA